MELDEVIKNRRSIRTFEPTKINRNIIEKLLYAGSLAPSGKNRQPWRFIVIQQEERIKNHIADFMLEKVVQKRAAGQKTGSIEKTANIIKEAPVFIVVLNTFQKHIQNSNLQSIGACIEHICLEATNLGLGSLWICDIDCCFKEIEQLLNVKEMNVVAGVALGYTQEKPQMRPRMSVEELTEWR